MHGARVAVSGEIVARQEERPVRIGADVGGTFTDVVLTDGAGRIWTHKLPSTPPDFEQAALQGIRRTLSLAGVAGGAVGLVSHGTTVATNAVLEGRGARTALITTAGFRDVLELRRIRAPQLYDLFFSKPPALIERRLRFEIGERVTAFGEVLRGVREEELQHIAASLVRERVESVAVCLLHAYAYPEHERVVGEFLRSAFLRRELPRLQVSLSCEILPERREYERTATTAVNAYVRPTMAAYLLAMRRGLDELGIGAPLLIMQSSGGLASEAHTARRPVFMLESGPAAGVLAANLTARRLGVANIVTLDMGGTTAKASLVEGGRVSYSAQYEVGASLSTGSRLVGGGGELIRAPTIDIAEVGAGGGSVAYVDTAGGLRVGPRSAGARPGPACYRRGGSEPTLTDANVVLGYIRPGPLADGDVVVDAEFARRSVADHVAGPLGLDLLAAAFGIHQIANATTMRALRQVSTERGRDPREFTLVAFGGAGPIHAAGLASDLAIRSVVIPPLPGLFSAMGLLFSGIEHHAVRSCLLSRQALSADALEAVCAELRADLLSTFAEEGHTEDEVAVRYSADVRFRGQTSEINVPLASGSWGPAELAALKAGFADEHERLYGHRSDPDNPVEVIALRAVGRAEVPDSSDRLRPGAAVAGESRDRSAWFGPSWGSIDTPVCRREDLGHGERGPLLIDEYDTTIVVPPGMRARVDDQLNAHIEPEGIKRVEQQELKRSS